jgi:hypothetical protein
VLLGTVTADGLLDIRVVVYFSAWSNTCARDGGATAGKDLGHEEKTDFILQSNNLRCV